ncbi:MAG: C40 family peptidase [Lachnospiraceae bacterium]|nr:C40 family peptidase [Lachnospiraceae bacterium]
MKMNFSRFLLLALTGCLMTAFPAAADEMAPDTEIRIIYAEDDPAEEGSAEETEASAQEAVNEEGTAKEEPKVIKEATQEAAGETAEVSKEETEEVTGKQPETFETDIDTDIDPASEAGSTSNVSLGRQVADFALQFLGRPYVWGGTSLTNGADCSGFTMSVYRNFGVSLPHSSASQRSAGAAVGSLEQALPGDLICYNGHVSLYIGGGQVVHALNAKKGIVVSNATYKRILAIRRVI